MHRPQRSLAPRVCIVAVAATLVLSISLVGQVPSGDRDKAIAYYQGLPDSIGFLGSTTIMSSTLDDVLVYMGYAGLKARDLEDLPSVVLMDPLLGGQPCPPSAATVVCGNVSDPAAFQQGFGTRPLRQGEILAARFFAPKITDVRLPADTRQLGWRKLVRLRARRDSQASRHTLEAAVILFNFFVEPNQKPFGPSARSVNTQVMLTSTTAGQDSIYWLDYGKSLEGSRLSLQLDATFDAADFQPASGASQGVPDARPYFVPDGCNACHGADNSARTSRALMNYLDTDHWFDRLDNDFARVRQEHSPVLFDAGSDDSSTSQFTLAFDVIRQFNEEAERHAAVAQPNAFHLASTRNWLALHANSNGHIPPINRALPQSTSWLAQRPVDRDALEMLNRYCFRCHGTIAFNVFDKAAVLNIRPKMITRLTLNDVQRRQDPFALMPRDRILEPGELSRLVDLISHLEK
jgi:hypothetical protein